MASTMVAAGAIALAPITADAAEPGRGARSFGGGDVPLELVRPAPAALPELTRPLRAAIASGRLLDHVRKPDVPAVLETAAAAGVDVHHLVAAGEHLSSLASAYGLQGDDGWRRLFDANPGIEDPDRLEAGTRLRIPWPGEPVERRELPAPAARSRPGSGPAGGSVWDRLAQCEAGGNWHINSGNGYYGGLQFSLRSWQAVGGTGYPHEHSRATQIAMGERLRAVQGWGAWPSCSRRLGLR